MGGGNFPEQRRLSGVRIADKRRVRDRAQLEEEMALLALFTLGVLNRRAVLRAFEMDIAFPAAAAFAEDKLLAIVRKISNGLRLIGPMGRMGLICLIWVNNRADRDLDHFRQSGTPVLFLPLSVHTALRLDDRLVKKIRKIIGVDIGPEDHIPAAPAIAAIRAAARDKFFAPKTDAPPPAIPGLGKNFYSVDKHLGNPGNLRGALRKVPLSRPLVTPSRADDSRVELLLISLPEQLLVQSFRFLRDLRPGELLLGAFASGSPELFAEGRVAH